MNEIIPVTPTSLIPTVSGLVAEFLSGRKQTTIDAYRRDLDQFGKFVGTTSADMAVNFLVSLPSGSANALALSYKNRMVEEGLSPATISRRLSAVKSILKLAKTVGLIGWTLEIKGPRVETYRDTRGPGVEGVRRILQFANGQENQEKSARDTALVRMMYDQGFRVSEVISLDFSSIDLINKTVKVIRKGRNSSEIRNLADGTASALSRWVEYRGTEEGPLFTNFDRSGKGGRHRSGKGGRLRRESAYRIVRDLGKHVSIKVRPHGLRHSAITAALDATNGDLRSVAKFSGHRKLDTLAIYDDSRRDMAGDVSKIITSAMVI